MKRVFKRCGSRDPVRIADLIRDGAQCHLLLDSAPDARAGRVGAEQATFAGVQDHYSVVVKRSSRFGMHGKTKIANLLNHALSLPSSLSASNLMLTMNGSLRAFRFSQYPRNHRL